MRASNLKRATIAFTIGLFALTSCNPGPCMDCENEIIERTDVAITGDLTFSEFNQSAESDPSADLITYNFYGNPSEYFDIIIQLSNGNQLLIKIYDAERMNPWQQIGQPYNVYPANELDDKLSYANVELRTAANEPLYATNLNSTTPQGISLDVFKITHYDGQTIQCRLRDMPLYRINDTERTIKINGTFIGAVTFE